MTSYAFFWSISAHKNLLTAGRTDKVKIIGLGHPRCNKLNKVYYTINIYRTDTSPYLYVSSFPFFKSSVLPVLSLKIKIKQYQYCVLQIQQEGEPKDLQCVIYILDLILDIDEAFPFCFDKTAT